MNTRALWVAIVLAAVIFRGGMPWATVVGQAPAQTTSIGTPSASSSGIEGKIMIGPMCPAARDAVCANRPYRATVIVKSGTEAQGFSREFARFRSNEKGYFRVVLPPGVYHLVPLSGSKPWPRAGSQTVVVRRNQFTSVVIRYDTGIR